MSLDHLKAIAEKFRVIADEPGQILLQVKGLRTIYGDDAQLNELLAHFERAVNGDEVRELIDETNARTI